MKREEIETAIPPFLNIIYIYIYLFFLICNYWMAGESVQ